MKGSISSIQTSWACAVCIHLLSNLFSHILGDMSICTYVYGTRITRQVHSFIAAYIPMGYKFDLEIANKLNCGRISCENRLNSLTTNTKKVGDEKKKKRE